jgi:hypothetical protein
LAGPEDRCISDVAMHSAELADPPVIRKIGKLFVFGKSQATGRRTVLRNSLGLGIEFAFFMPYHMAAVKLPCRALRSPRTACDGNSCRVMAPLHSGGTGILPDIIGAQMPMAREWTQERSPASKSLLEIERWDKPEPMQLNIRAALGHDQPPANRIHGGRASPRGASQRLHAQETPQPWVVRGIIPTSRSFWTSSMF